MGVKDPILPSVWVNSCLMVKWLSHSQATFFFPSGLGMRLATCYVSCYNAANNASFLKLSQNEITTDIEEITHHKLDVYICHEMKYTHAPAQ